MFLDPPRRSENFTSALLQDMALPVLAALGKSDALPDFAEPLLAAVVVHYFATRS